MERDRIRDVDSSMVNETVLRAIASLSSREWFPRIQIASLTSTPWFISLSRYMVYTPSVLVYRAASAWPFVLLVVVVV